MQFTIITGLFINNCDLTKLTLDMTQRQGDETLQMIAWLIQVYKQW